MRGGLLLSTVLLMIVVSDLISGFLWRTRHTAVNDYIFGAKEDSVSLNKPSDIFRKTNRLQSSDGFYAEKRHKQTSAKKSHLQRTSMTFREFTKHRQSLRDEKRKAREYQDNKYDEDNNRGDVRLRDSGEHVMMDGFNPQFDGVINDKYFKWQNGKKQIKTKKEPGEPQKVQEQMMTEESAAWHSNIPKKVQGMKAAHTINNLGEITYKAIKVVKQVAPLEATPLSPQSLHEGHHEKTLRSENIACSPDKPCEKCFSTQYHVLALVVSAVWVTNIVFVAWIVCGRRSNSNMRIQTGFVHKSPHISANKRLSSLSTEISPNKSLRRPSTARSRPLTLQSKSQKSTTLPTGASPLIYSQTHLGRSTGLSEVSKISHVRESTKKTPLSQEAASGWLRSAAVFNIARNHLSHKTVHGNNQKTLSPIEENSQLEHALVRTRLVDGKQGQMKLDEGDVGDKKCTEVQCKKKEAQTDKKCTDRRIIATSAPLSGGDTRESHTKQETFDVGRYGKIWQQPVQTVCEDFNETPVQKNVGQGECYLGNADTSERIKQDRYRLIEAKVVNIGCHGNEQHRVHSKIWVDKVVSTQKMLLGSDNSSPYRSVGRKESGSSQSPASPPVHMPRNTWVGEYQTSPVRMVWADSKLTHDTECRGRPKPALTHVRNQDGCVTTTDGYSRKKQACSDEILTILPGHNRLETQLFGSPRIKRHVRDMKPILHPPPRSVPSEQSPPAKNEGKLHYKQTAERSNGSVKCLVQEADVMAPPPRGYHVRRDFSNPDSSTELIENICFTSAGDTHVASIPYPDGARRSFKVVSSSWPHSKNSCGQMWRFMLRKQGPPEKEHGLRRNEYQNRSTAKKLVIIGKLKCSRRSIIKRLGKDPALAQFVLSRDTKSGRCEKHRDSMERSGHRSTRIICTKPQVISPQYEKHLSSGEKHKEHRSPTASRSCIGQGHFESVSDDFRCYYKLPDNKAEHMPGLYLNRHAHPSSQKVRSTACFNEINMNTNSLADTSPKTTIFKEIDSHQGMKIALKTSKKPIGRKSNKKLANVCSNLRLLCVGMNVNSNAGISESRVQAIAGGKSSEARRSSSSGVQSSDQHHNTYTLNTSVGNLHVSQLSSNTLFVEDSTTPDIEPMLQSSLVNASTASDERTQDLQGQEDKQNLTQSWQESALGKIGKTDFEQTNSDKDINLRSEHGVSRSNVSLIISSKDSQDPSANCRNNKNTKYTELTPSKFGKSTPHKTAISAVLVERKMTPVNKQRQKRHKQQPLSDDIQKVVRNALENSDKNAADGVLRVVSAAATLGTDHLENFETKLKTKPCSETCVDYATMKETHGQARPYFTSGNHGVRSTESDGRYCPPMDLASTPCGSGEVSHNVSLPKTVPSGDPTSKPRFSPNFHIATSDPQGSGYICDMTSPEDIQFNIQEASQVTPIGAVKLGSKQKKKIGSTITLLKNIKSPQKDFNISPKIRFSSSSGKELNDSPKGELSNLQNRNEDNDQTVPMKTEGTSNKSVEGTEAALSATENESVKKAEWSNKLINQDSEGVGWLKNCRSKARYSPCNRSLNEAVSCSGRTTKCDLLTEELVAGDDRSESINERLHTNASSSKKKNALSRLKPHSRSPEGKKRKKCTIRKGSCEREGSKSEKAKKLKNGDKVIEKKKKKKKQKQRTPENVEVTPRLVGQTRKAIQVPRSKSIVSHRTTQTCLPSTSKCLDVITPDPNISPASHSAGDRESRLVTSKRRQRLLDPAFRSLDRQHAWKSEEPKNNISAVSSAENIFTSPASVRPVPTAESFKSHPVISADVKAPDSIVQPPICPKVKRNEKNLQQAELGWNTSTFSNDEKGIVEKAKQNQKRAMIRYYIVKPKPKKSEKELVASKLKRSAQHSLDQLDHDLVCCSSDIDAKDDTALQEKSKPGQVKSVQFSDNIEELEASKDESPVERALRKPDSDHSLHHPIAKAASEALRPTTDALSTAKLMLQKKEEVKSQVMPPRKRRPMWLKKSVNDKPKAIVKVRAIMRKSLTTVVPVKQRHSTDNLLKPTSHFNMHLYYPVKHAPRSPIINKTSINYKDKGKYNTWLRGIFRDAPSDKSSVKMLAKTGSPVDIKENTEGSSVDAVDHLRSKRKSAHDGFVRAAKSVPFLGPQKAFGTDVFSGKKMKASFDDFRFPLNKKSKEVKLRGKWSPRSYSATDTKEDISTSVKSGSGVSGTPSSPKLSTEAEDGILKEKTGYSRMMDLSKQRRKERKLGRRRSQESATKWQLVTSQEAGSVPNLAEARYCGDIMDLSMLNMGLAWVVQSVVSRLPFLNQRQADPSAASSTDLPSERQFVD